MVATGLLPSGKSLDIDAVEYARAAIAAFSHVEPNRGREVHILRLRAAFERADLTHRLRPALSILKLIGEVEDLGGGYWFPAPLRCVRVGARALVIAPQPTRELRRHLPGIAKAGYARVTDDELVSGFPHQPLENWLGLDIPDSKVWVRNQVDGLRLRMGPTLSPERAEFFTVVSWRRAGSEARVPLWSSNVESALQPVPGIALCRQHLGGASVRYFWARVGRGSVTEECAVEGQSERVKFGLAALASQAITVRVKTVNGATLFELPSPCYLPREERRLALAVALAQRSYVGKVYSVLEEPLAFVFAAALRSLGCELRLLDG